MVTKFQKCIFCSHSDVKVLISKDALPCGVSVLKCAECGLVFLEPRVGEDELDPEEKLYWDGEKQKKIYLQEKIQNTFEKEFERRLSKMEHYTTRSGKVLDVGCGVGHFLGAARKRGWEARGLDISEAASQAAREAYGLEVAVGTLEEAKLTSGEFDAVTLWDVIEHMRRPVDNIKAANRLLRMGGILAIKTPNERSLFKLLARLCYHVLGRRGSFLLKYVYYVPHYFSYSTRTMTKLLELTGFEVIQYEMDETPAEFATEKINIHYQNDSKRKWIITLLPVVQLLARMLGKSNKMVVYAKKVREVNGVQWELPEENRRERESNQRKVFLKEVAL